MATFMYNGGAKEVMDGTIDLDTNTLKIMLVTGSYAANKDDDFVDAGGANDPVDHELNVAGYTRGYGGAGRKTATVTVAVDDTNDRGQANIADLTWTALATGQTIEGAILIKEGAVNDTTSRLIIYFDLASTGTNGGDVTLDFSTVTGALQFNT